MSQYFSIKVGFIHDEDYQGWLDLCLKLKSVGLLDDDSEAYEFSWVIDDGIFHDIFEAVKKGEDASRLIQKFCEP